MEHFTRKNNYVKIKYSPTLLILSVVVFSFLFLGATNCFAQDKPGTSFSGPMKGDPSVCPQSSNYLTPEDVNNLVTLILKKIGIKNRYIIKACPQVDNCQAVLYKGKPYILYNPEFLNKVKKLNFTNASLPEADDKDWETLTILAHELGHHINNHLLNPQPDAKQRDMELEADETAGFIIYLLGGTLNQAQLAYYDINVSEEGDYEHPPRKQRLDAIDKGWNNAAKEYPKSPQPIKPLPPSGKNNNDPTVTLNAVGDYCFNNVDRVGYKATVSISKAGKSDVLKSISVNYGETNCMYELPPGIYTVNVSWSDRWSNAIPSTTHEIRIKSGVSGTLQIQH